MKILLSPAKLMSVDHKSDVLRNTTPKFIHQSEIIQSYLKQKSPKDLQQMMSISEKLADENWERNQKWTAKPTPKNSTQAIFAFQGEVYRGLSASTLKPKELDYLQDHLIMLSGLYGMLRPSDKIMLYRLEMGSKFGFEKNKNLYQFWTESLTNFLNSQLKSKEIVLNLASEEYAKVLDRKKIKNPIVDVEFKEMKNGKLIPIMVFFKQARGLIARFCAENNLQTLEDIKSFNVDGYLLNHELSSENHLVFTRG